MSSALAIAAVTASLKDLLNNGMIDHDLSSVGSFSITAQPPDRITTGQTESNQLNLFLYQVTPNSGWRNAALPSRDVLGARISNPPLALDLHYLLSAYGAQDCNAEILLGYAMQLLHENSVLTRAQLRTALAPTSPVDGSIVPGPFGPKIASDLADQVEQIKIAPTFLTSEDLSKLWTAMQARYRPSMAYLVSVVLIESEGGVRAALPVLKRGKDDRGNDVYGVPAPVLSAARHAASPLFPAVRLGDDILVTGTRLDRADVIEVVFECVHLGIALTLEPASGTSSTKLQTHLPSVADDPSVMNAWGVGVYNVSLRVAATDEPKWTTNSVPLALAPRISLDTPTAAAGTVDVTVTCTPRLRPEQTARARLLFGSRQVKPASVDTPADVSKPSTLAFSIPDVTAGTYLVRLRVDGIDSLPVTFSSTSPPFEFDPQQMVKVT